MELKPAGNLPPYVALWGLGFFARCLASPRGTTDFTIYTSATCRCTQAQPLWGVNILTCRGIYSSQGHVCKHPPKAARAVALMCLPLGHNGPSPQHAFGAHLQPSSGYVCVERQEGR